MNLIHSTECYLHYKEHAGTSFQQLQPELTVKRFENSVLGRNMGLRGRKWQEAGENWIMMSFIICTLHQILLGLSDRRVRQRGRARSMQGRKKEIRNKSYYHYNFELILIQKPSSNIIVTIIIIIIIIIIIMYPIKNRYLRI